MSIEHCFPNADVSDLKPTVGQLICAARVTSLHAFRNASLRSQNIYEFQKPSKKVLQFFQITNMYMYIE